VVALSNPSKFSKKREIIRGIKSNIDERQESNAWKLTSLPQNVSTPLQISMISKHSHGLIFEFLDILFGECASFGFFFYLKLFLKKFISSSLRTGLHSVWDGIS